MLVRGPRAVPADLGSSPGTDEVGHRCPASSAYKPSRLPPGRLIRASSGFSSPSPTAR
ncbi:hypothetical protein HMPREF1979_01596 [Actinomyces johnsonii F0542]|uniref:Uncharacterized protein n=2 Tax=Actinomyces johnsonii TaxID=544581 RepID=U1Q7Z4_9ACTO|nr:hypothetical protein HMPREF1549_02644 [Actinomyces johnsonii F0510]ERH23935.1 hypothetical protein HMPREF1979_01596 [Actinomyces johnsonii F0542]